MERQEVLNFLGKIPHIHRGGCLISAYAFYLYEKKMGRMTDDFKIVALDNSENNIHIDLNNDFLEGKRKNGVGCHHFAWTFTDGTIQDAQGAVEKYKHYLKIPFDVTDKFCLSTLNHNNWNWQFDRQYYVPLIAEKLGVDLSKVYIYRDKDSSDGFQRSGSYRKRRKWFDFTVTSLNLDI